MAEDEKVDVVFTWVDDSFPGYAETLRQYSDDFRDANPNRTRDNLHLMKYALRSIHAHLPELRHIFILSCRPQVPSWLNAEHPGLFVIHHDAIMTPEILPTFNSFAIVSHLHLMPGLSERFLYFEDDMLLLQPGILAALQSSDGRPLGLFNQLKTVPTERLDANTSSPWNLALANSDKALHARFPIRKRFHVIHGPALIVRDRFAEFVQEFETEIAATRATKFRSGGNIVSEYTYPHFMVEKGFAPLGGRAEADRIQGYVSLDNLSWWTALKLWRLARRNPVTATFNDNFGNRPNPATEAVVKRWLNKRFPDPSPYEKLPTSHFGDNE